MGAERQIYIQTYIQIQTHTHFSENNFSKLGPLADCGHTPGLKFFQFKNEIRIDKILKQEMMVLQ